MGNGFWPVCPGRLGSKVLGRPSGPPPKTFSPATVSGRRPDRGVIPPPSGIILPMESGEGFRSIIRENDLTLNPSKIVCVGKNYADHAKEMGGKVPPEPLLFLKPPSALIRAGEPIVLP